MKIEMRSQRQNGGEYFEFTLTDGPQEEEKVRGYATDLIVAFTKIIEWRERISREYEDPGSLPG